MRDSVHDYIWDMHEGYIYIVQPQYMVRSYGSIPRREVIVTHAMSPTSILLVSRHGHNQLSGDSGRIHGVVCCFFQHFLGVHNPHVRALWSWLLIELDNGQP